LAFAAFAPSSQAAAAESSSMTIGWAADSSSAAAYQPARDANGFEYDEFKNIKVTVQQTANLVDQAVQIDMSGFTGGTTQQTDFTGQNWTSAQNFMQAMQCWGADPSATDFRTTCEWGGRYVQTSANGLGNSVYRDNVFRVASRDVPSNAVQPVDVPFVSADGSSLSGRETTDASGNTIYPILSVFGPSSTNEVQSALVNSDGTGSFDFEAQSANTAPQLGCGSPTHLRCWLVLVPRGTISGSHGAACTTLLNTNFQEYAYGETTAIQAGSPLNPGCDYWNNRMIVPLTFNPVTLPCPSGVEQSLIGSQLVIGAMASWQSALCTAAGAPFSFVSNPDSVARAQLLEVSAGSTSSGNPHLAFTSYPLAKDDFADNPDDQTIYDKTAFSYAPVAIGASVVAFTADGRNGQITSLVLSPRLLAKLLTQSYPFELPASPSDGDLTVNGATIHVDKAQLGAVNQSYNFFSDDPEFRALNSNWAQFVSNPSVVLPGPSGADAIKQMWKWIGSDSAARDFLNGKPDPSGMTVNPYYLPAGSAGAQVPTFDTATGALNPTPLAVGRTNLDGTPATLATSPIDYFPKLDASEVPHVLSGPTAPKSRFDSVQFSPYVDDFVKSAKTTFRANPGSKIRWDPTAINSSGIAGDWVTGGPQLVGQRFTIGITDAAAAIRYDLPVASLQAANGTSVTQPTQSAMSAAVTTGLTTTSSASVGQIDPAKVSSSGYPLTTVVYAAINLSTSNTATLATLSKLLKFVAGAGQSVGTLPGQLPLGYLPLTSGMVSQTNAAAAAVASYTGPSSSSPSGSGSQASDSYYAGVGGSAAGSSDGSAAPGSGPTVTAVDASSSGRTPRVDAPPIVQAGLAVSLGFGLIGALVSPVVFRGRGRL
jgi:hypothetical protein